MHHSSVITVAAALLLAVGSTLRSSGLATAVHGQPVGPVDPVGPGDRVGFGGCADDAAPRLEPDQVEWRPTVDGDHVTVNFTMGPVSNCIF